jgi:hypothetical protein
MEIPVQRNVVVENQWQVFFCSIFLGIFHGAAVAQRYKRGGGDVGWQFSSHFLSTPCLRKSMCRENYADRGKFCVWFPFGVP